MNRFLGRTFCVLATAALAAAVASGCGASAKPASDAGVDSVAVPPLPEADSISRYSGLTDEDFIIVARQLDVEVAAIKAVVVIEAGKDMKGFWAPGVPVVNFDRSVFSKYRGKGPGRSDKVPSGLSGYALKEWTQLVNARRISGDGADMGTFWGMFQIGGFNYRICGCGSVKEFVTLMSTSELEQLELFAALIVNTGMIADLRNKNWAGFARKYNGSSYARRGYHIRMATAYKKFKNEN